MPVVCGNSLIHVYAIWKSFKPLFWNASHRIFLLAYKKGALNFPYEGIFVHSRPIGINQSFFS